MVNSQWLEVFPAVSWSDWSREVRLGLLVAKMFPWKQGETFSPETVNMICIVMKKNASFPQKSWKIKWMLVYKALELYGDVLLYTDTGREKTLL